MKALYLFLIENLREAYNFLKNIKNTITFYTKHIYIKISSWNLSSNTEMASHVYRTLYFSLLGISNLDPVYFYEMYPR